MYARCEGDGTLYLDDDIRSRYGEIFAVVETEDGILLMPAEGDPVKDGKRVARFLLGEKRDSQVEPAELEDHVEESDYFNGDAKIGSRGLNARHDPVGWKKHKMDRSANPPTSSKDPTTRR